MKRITLILGDGYDSLISVTAIGNCDTMINISNGAYKVHDGDTLYFPKETKPLLIRKDGVRKELDNDTQ